LTNAIKFTDNGHVELRLQVLASEADAQTVELAVSDTGIGIPAERIGQLFRPYEQAHAAGATRLPGTGLGLVLCRRLIDAMGGQVRLSSLPDEGTVATINLRLVLGAALAPNEASGTLRVLVVEDDRVQQILLSSALEQLGCMVDIASDGQKGLVVWRAHRHDLVLCDLHMPGVGGEAFLERLRQEAGGADVEVVGTSADLDDSARMLKVGFSRLVPKPISFAALGDVVRAHARRSDPSQATAPQGSGVRHSGPADSHPHPPSGAQAGQRNAVPAPGQRSSDFGARDGQA